jgi:hypothetical protein
MVLQLPLSFWVASKRFFAFIGGNTNILINGTDRTNYGKLQGNAK